MILVIWSIFFFVSNIYIIWINFFISIFNIIVIFVLKNICKFICNLYIFIVYIFYTLYIKCIYIIYIRCANKFFPLFFLNSRFLLLYKSDTRLSNCFSRIDTVCLMISNLSANSFYVWVGFSLNNSSNSLLSNFLDASEWSLSSKLTFLVLNLWYYFFLHVL